MKGLNTIKRTILLFNFTLIAFSLFAQKNKATSPKGVTSIDTKYTMMKVRTAVSNKQSYIVASSYEGTMMGIAYDGTILWKNELSGFMNQDVWCEDLTGDGNDEILAANSDGSLYCLDEKGKLKWTFKPNETPMNAVVVTHKDGKPYVVCGGYDMNIYYLSADGKKLKEVASTSYSKEKADRSAYKMNPPKGLHTANFLRIVKYADGSEAVMLQGASYTMGNGRGAIYLFKPLEIVPFKQLELQKGGVFGDLRAVDVDNDGNDELIGGTSVMIHESEMLLIDLKTDKQTKMEIDALGKKIDNFGYRVVQSEIIKEKNKNIIFTLFGSRIILTPLSINPKEAEVLACKYAFNDMWKDPKTQKIILASSQSGGSCVHIIDLNVPSWKDEYQNLNPPGKIADILANTKTVRTSLDKFKKSSWEREPLPVYLMSENLNSPLAQKVSDDIKAHFKSPVFMNSANSDKEKWDRSVITNEKYRTRADKRMKYILSQDQVVENITKKYQNGPGISYWAGHGNDPYMYQLSTTEKVLDAAKGKKTIMIYPELEDHTADFSYVMDNLIYPLAKYAQDKNGSIYVRTKHTFWQTSAYLPMWSKLLSGEYAHVFVPAMEETSDKSMDLSVASRLGIWTSGATDSWGARCARDNPSFDRMRQHSHQMLPNHFLRNMVYAVSSGAQYLDNFTVDQDYMSLLWELIAKGALYVPKKSEILSFSPVHLSMTSPDEAFLETSSNVKWTTFWNKDYEEKNPMVFSHLNGTWPGAPVTEWDFSRYAAGVKERRLNFIPPYQNGMVLITPPQNGVFADKNAKRGALTEHLNPVYKNIMKEYYTDGRNYYSADGKQTYSPKEYYKVVEEDIKKSADLLPLTVSGEVGWVVAQTSPTHLRLTLVDGGYINPNARVAKVTFHTIKPVKIIDILDGKNYDTKGSNTVNIDVPLGMFRFIDIELSQPLK